MRSFINKIKSKDIIIGIITICLFTMSVILLEDNRTVTTSSQALSTKKIGWGIKINDNHEQPDLGKNNKEVLEKNNGIAMGSNTDKYIYLTFDEGYEAGYTSQILNTLKENDVKATFFITAHYLNTQPELVKQMIDEEHIVGNHTVNHPNLHKLTEPQKMADELGGLNTEFFRKYGKNMEYMRPPEGEYSERLLAVANELGYKTVLWSFAYKDWDVNSQKGAEYAFEQVTPYLHDGAILLLHAVSKDNAESLGNIIDYAKEQGYQFESLDELESY